MAITTQEGFCFGLERNGQQVATKPCRSRFNVAIDGSRIRAVLQNGTEGCLDGYRGKGERAEVVACDNTPEQDWYRHGNGQIQNVATSLCLDLQGGGRRGGVPVISWECTGAENQLFRFEAADPIGGVAAVGIDPSATAAPQAGGGGAVGSGRSDGASLIGQDGAGLIGQDGAGLIGQDGAGLIGQDGAGLIGQDGAGLIGQDGAGVAPTYGVQSVSEGQLIQVGGLCLDGNYNPVSARDCGTASRFDLSGGTLRIAGSTNCVDGWRGQYKVGHEYDGNVKEYARVETCDGSQEQNWAHHLQQGGGFFLRDTRYGFCLDVEGGVEPGRSVLLWVCNDGQRPVNQIFAVRN